MITTTLRVLLVEDLKSDADLISIHIAGIVQNPEIKVVNNLSDLKNEMLNFVPDVVISDYDLPTCNGLEVMELSRSIDPRIPFIFLTATIDDEELAMDTVLSGASAFILKKDMEMMDQKLLPFLKSVVLGMEEKEETREWLRRSKITINKTRHHLEALKAGNHKRLEHTEILKNTVEQVNKEDR